MLRRKFKVGFLLVGVFLIATASNGRTSASGAIVHLGWLTASHAAGGWQVTSVADPTPSASSLREGDLIVSVDDFRLTGVGALTAARILNRIRLNARSVTLMRSGSLSTLTLHTLSEPFAAYALWSEANANPPVVYGANDALPDLSLPDAYGQTHRITFRGEWTLLHLWNTGCDPHEVAALNEIASPSHNLLNVVGVVMHDTGDSVRQFSATRQKIEFLNLLGGEYTGDFAGRINYFSLRTDILVNPNGQVVFVGNGPGSLKAAWLEFKMRAHQDDID